MKILKWLDEKFEEHILIGSLIVTVTLIFVQVIMRYVFKNSLSWSEELARYIFLYQIWLGASYATKKSQHLRIQIIKSRFSERDQIKVDTFALLIWLTFCVFLTVLSFNLTSAIYMRGQLSPALRIPMSYAYASVPLGCGLMSIRLVQQIIENLKTIKKPAVEIPTSK